MDEFFAFTNDRGGVRRFNLSFEDEREKHENGEIQFGLRGYAQERNLLSNIDEINYDDLPENLTFGTNIREELKFRSEKTIGPAIGSQDGWQGQFWKVTTFEHHSGSMNWIPQEASSAIDRGFSRLESIIPEGVDIEPLPGLLDEALGPFQRADLDVYQLGLGGKYTATREWQATNGANRSLTIGSGLIGDVELYHSSVPFVSDEVIWGCAQLNGELSVDYTSSRQFHDGRETSLSIGAFAVEEVNSACVGDISPTLIDGQDKGVSVSWEMKF